MKKLYVVCIILLVFTVFGSSLVFAQKPNFTGNWKMNKAKSDLGMYAEAIIDIKLKIEHEGVNFKTVSTSNTTMQGEVTQEFSYTTDGKEIKNTDAQGNPMTSVAKWKDNVLVINTTVESPMGSAEIKVEYSLSEDKKQLNMNQNINSPMGEVVFKVVLDKYTPEK